MKNEIKLAAKEEMIQRKVSYYKKLINRELKDGTININKDGKIKKSEYLGRDYETGKPIRIYGEGETVDKCARKLAIASLQAEGKLGSMKITKRTFAEVAEEWYETEIAHDAINDKNKYNYRLTLKNHLIPNLGKFEIAKIKPGDYKRFINSYAGKGVSTVRYIKTTLNRIIKYATAEGYREDIDVILKLPKTKPFVEKTILNDNLIKLLIKAQKEYWPAYVFVCMVATGMRPCELYHIKYENIDFENKTMRILISKNENGIRTVPIPDYALELIKQDRENLIAKGICPEYVFHQVKNPLLPHTSNSLKTNWETTLRYMDILLGAEVYRNKIIVSKFEGNEKYVPYSLRHTYCTKLNDCGIGEYFKKRLMGHTLNDSITDSVYTHSSVERVMEAAKPFLEEFEKLVKESE